MDREQPEGQGSFAAPVGHQRPSGLRLREEGPDRQEGVLDDSPQREPALGTLPVPEEG